MNTDGRNEVNPYEPPSVDVNAKVTAPVQEGELAERGTRLAAQMLDGFMAFALMSPAIFHVGRSVPGGGGSLAFFRGFFSGGLATICGVAWVVLMGLQAYLLTTTGQSLGKRWLKIKIVRLDGSQVNFVTGVLLRNWLFMLLQYLPGIATASGILDSLFIFRSDRRCLHDFVAGTKVVQLKGAAKIRVV
jgi:uncharacterized RDD family membrane protein YckC